MCPPAHPVLVTGTIILCNKSRVCISKILNRKIGKRIDFHSSSKGSHDSVPEAVYQTLDHKNSKIHYGLLYTGHGRKTDDLLQNLLVKVPFAFIWQQFFATKLHVKKDTNARYVLCNYSGGSSASNSIRADSHKKQVQCNVHES